MSVRRVPEAHLETRRLVVAAVAVALAGALAACKSAATDSSPATGGPRKNWWRATGKGG